MLKDVASTGVAATSVPRGARPWSRSIIKPHPVLGNQVSTYENITSVKSRASILHGFSFHFRLPFWSFVWFATKTKHKLAQFSQASRNSWTHGVSFHRVGVSYALQKGRSYYRPVKISAPTCKSRLPSAASPLWGALLVEIALQVTEVAM